MKLYLLTMLFSMLVFPQFTIAQTLNNSPNDCNIKVKKVKPKLLKTLDKALSETSGLIIDSNYLWSHNDSGNEPFLFQIDKQTGNIIRKVYVQNSLHKDWEALTQNDNYVFLGDFGNNKGNRKDLHILKISKNDLYTQDSVKAAIINFEYPDQTDFSATKRQTSFDCEAMIYKNDSLYLFTKDWKDNHTKVYALPINEGRYIAHFIAEFDIKGLVTDASYDANKNTLVLLSYKRKKSGIFQSKITLLYPISNHPFFSNCIHNIKIGNALQVGQTEGITFDNNGNLYISAEAIQKPSLRIDKSAQLMKIDKEQLQPKLK